MKIDDAIALLKKHHLPEGRIEHCRAVGDFAGRLARVIQEKHPELPLSPQKVCIAGILHDVGRSRHGDHEINSIEILRDEKLHQYAEIVIHGTIFEIMQLRGEHRPELLPRGLENKIVAYADARVRFAPSGLQERIDEVIARRRDEPEKVRSVLMAKSRYIALEQELLELAGEDWEKQTQ